jgi:chorismate-pyruvate lyase
MPGRPRSIRRRSRARSRGPVLTGGATDEFDGLGRVEQLVLRGDGLTTTSLQILTGEEITVSVVGHWHVTASEPGALRSTSGMHDETDGPDTERYLWTAREHLSTVPGDALLIREVLLAGPTGSVHGTAEVIAVLPRLSQPVAEALSATDQPNGRLLREHGISVTRELRYWGLMPAGPRYARLGPDLDAASRVPGRTYLMRLSGTGQPLAQLTEWFAPHVFR